MKYLWMIMAGLAVAGNVSAAEFFTVDGPSYQGLDPPGPRQVTITQNNDITQIDPVQVACGVVGVYTTQNFFLRRFFLSADHGLEYSFQVSGVYFGVQSIAMADGATPPPYDVTLRLYTIPVGAAFTFANLTEIGHETVTLHESDIGTILYAESWGFVNDCSNYDLVVALDAPSGEGVGSGLSFLPGANTLGATHDAYLAADECGVREPVAVGDIGFPDSQTIFAVYGGTGGIIPTETRSWGKVKALYR